MSLKNRLQNILGAEDIVEEVIPAPVEVEEEIVVLPDVPGADHAIAVASGELATAELGMVQQEAIISQAEDDIDELEDRVDYLENRLGGLEAMMTGERPWNPELAQSLYNDAQTVLARTFGAESLKCVVGAEGFADLDTAQLQLVEGVEDIKERAKKMASGAKKFFEGLYNAVISFFENIYNAIVSVEKQADGVLSKLGGMKDDSLKKTIKLGKWNAYLDIGGGSGGGADKLAKARAPISTIGSALKSQTADSVKSGVISALNSFISAGSDKKEKSSNDNTHTTSVSIGGVRFTVTVPKSDAKSMGSALSSAGISYSASGEGVKTSGDQASSAAKSTLVTVTKRVKTEAAQARSSGLSASDLKAARDKAIAALEKTDESKEAASIIKNGNSAALKISKTLVKYQLDMLRATLAFVAAHYGGKGGDSLEKEEVKQIENKETKQIEATA